MDRDKAQEKKQHQQALLDRAFDRLVGSQLTALQAKGSKTLTEEDEERYRATLAAEREAAEKKKRKVLSAEHAELARTTGLSGQVVAMMAKAGTRSDDSGDEHGGGGKGDRKSSSKKRSKKSSRGSSRKPSSRSRSRKKKSSHRRSRSYSSDSFSSRGSYSSYSSYSSGSYTSSDDDSRRKKSKKKRHRKSKESKKRKHKHRSTSSSKSNLKRDRKKSRHADDNNISSSGNLTAQFGKYGIIKESDFIGNNQRVRRSFDMWLSEVKGIASFNGPKGELLELYKQFAEDYNTATLPHIKYYDYDKWEMEEYARRKREAEDAATGGGSKAKSDEFRHREEMREERERKRRAEVELMRATVSAKREEMKSQALLKAELENAYKTGDQEKIRSLKRRLEPEERR